MCFLQDCVWISVYQGSSVLLSCLFHWFRIMVFHSEISLIASSVAHFVSHDRSLLFIFISTNVCHGWKSSSLKMLSKTCADILTPHSSPILFVKSLCFCYPTSLHQIGFLSEIPWDCLRESTSHKASRLFWRCCIMMGLGVPKLLVSSSILFVICTYQVCIHVFDASASS